MHWLQQLLQSKLHVGQRHLRLWHEHVAHCSTRDATRISTSKISLSFFALSYLEFLFMFRFVFKSLEMSDSNSNTTTENLSSSSSAVNVCDKIKVHQRKLNKYVRIRFREEFGKEFLLSHDLHECDQERFERLRSKFYFYDFNLMILFLKYNLMFIFFSRRGMFGHV